MESADCFTLYDAAGRFGEQIENYAIAMGTAMATGRQFMSGRWDGGLFYVQDGIATHRPKVWLASEVTLPADGSTVFAITDLPPATRVRFGRDPEGWHLIEDTLFEFVTAHVETVLIEFDPPFPWQTQTITVISHAV